MQADIVAIDTRALNLWPAHDAVAAVLQASIINIEAVMVGGVWRKRDHRMVDFDLASVFEALQRSGDRLVGLIEARGMVSRLRQGVVKRVVHRTLMKQNRN